MDKSPSSVPMPFRNSGNIDWINAGWDTNHSISCMRAVSSMIMLPFLIPVAKIDIRLRNAVEYSISWISSQHTKNSSAMVLLSLCFRRIHSNRIKRVNTSAVLLTVCKTRYRLLKSGIQYIELHMFLFLLNVFNAVDITFGFVFLYQNGLYQQYDNSYT